MTTSASLERARVMANFLPSGDHAYAATTAGSESKWVNCIGGPPASGCMYTFSVLPVVLCTYVIARPSGVHPNLCQPYVKGSSISLAIAPSSSFCTTIFDFALDPCPTVLPYAINLPSGEATGENAVP